MSQDSKPILSYTLLPPTFLPKFGLATGNPKLTLRLDNIGHMALHHLFIDLFGFLILIFVYSQ